METKKFFKKTVIFLPLLFYFGQRSLIAFDEGYYALQAKWILDNNNWIAPLWWDQIILDRTIGIQYLIALSQKIFGASLFSIYIPSITAGVIMIFLTYEIHKELLGNKYKIISPLILSTTFLWLNYFHMASQDILFSSLITIGIYSSIKSFKTKNNYYFFLSGAWIGLAAMFKTYLVLIPLLAILPFLYNSKILKNYYFWFGLILGFLPFTIWSFNIISIYSFDTWNGLYSKLVTLSKDNNFTNPFYYYLWNLPLNALPWSIFAIIGFYNSFKLKNKISFYFLFKFPIFVIFLLSIFSTKTPYYPLQILPLISINSYLGITYIFSKNNLFTKIFRPTIFIVFPFLVFILLIYIILFFDKPFLETRELIFISLGITFFIFSWLSLLIDKSFKNRLFLLIVGPYLLMSLTVQSGILNDRSKNIRIESQNIVKKENLYNKKIEVIKSGNWDEKATSKIIRIALLMPKIGNGIKNLEDLKVNQYAWTLLNKKEIEVLENYEILNESELLKPWKLIIRK